MYLSILKSEVPEIIDNSKVKLCSFQKSIINEMDAYFINFKCNYDYLNCEEELSEEKLEKYHNDELGINTHGLKEMCNVLEENYTAMFEKSKIKIDDFHYYIINFKPIFESIKNREPLDFFCAITTLAFCSDMGMKFVKFLNKVVKQKIASCKLGVLSKYLITSKKVFIAISFDESMNSARSAIRETIIDAGYLPVFIDEKEHNNSIVPEIFKEIEDSLFVIADITGHKNGVYYEAGYANALKKPVIFSCRHSDFENAHFDVKQINTICWKDVSNLKNRLSERINCYDFAVEVNRVKNTLG